MAIPIKICCAVDFAEPSRLAMRSASELARQLGAELVLVHAVQLPSFIVPGSAVEPEEMGKSPTDEAEREMVDWRAEATKILGRPVTSDVVCGEPHRAIVNFVRDQRCDLVVGAMNDGKGMKERILGSVAERLVRDAPCPVMIDRPRLTRVGTSAPQAA